ncbi:predicted protein [Postia placenta Mad-698-R]|uniref:Uncharacterized protein n=1 Tax=Postia placenta MAD-698-R-SB12 TaxID=670580 RepID=A0A1X6MT04_9APHY|nr:hypothetical protein POSPLADRAFT_1048838 [Postia placenta MAD-698-R-SB12]EED81096.1 predicted protein [Postia placenta Mad-698-R]OSX59524.1 hypothetical protein POSPLADRAFT_1048838 [Postia placenta MAD-698-R-SB12]
MAVAGLISTKFGERGPGHLCRTSPYSREMPPRNTQWLLSAHDINILVDEGWTHCPIPKCGYTQERRRPADFKRHLETHCGKKYVCCGEPVYWEVGVKGPMHGGCRRRFCRIDALQRHLENPKMGCRGNLYIAEAYREYLNDTNPLTDEIVRVLWNCASRLPRDWTSAASPPTMHNRRSFLSRKALAYVDDSFPHVRRFLDGYGNCLVVDLQAREILTKVWFVLKRDGWTFQENPGLSSLEDVVPAQNKCMLQLDVPETLHEVLIKEENIFAEFGTFLRYESAGEAQTNQRKCTTLAHTRHTLPAFYEVICKVSLPLRTEMAYFRRDTLC